MSKKILVSFSGSFCGGAENMMLELIDVLVSDKMNFDILLNNKGEVYNKLKGSNKIIATLKVNEFFNKTNPFKFIFNLIRIVFFIIKNKYDLVIVEGKFLSQIFSFAGKVSGVEIVSYVHYPPGGYEIKRVYKYINKILLCSKGIEKYFLENDISNDKLFILNNLVDTEKFNIREKNFKYLQKLDIEESDIIILLTGHLSKVKGQELAIKALHNLKRKHKNIKLLLAGSDNSDSNINLKHLTEIVSDLSMESEVHFIGKVNNIAEILNSSDIFILPSYKEGMPLSILEAMSSGLPVIASNIDGNPYLIKDKFNGLLIESGSLRDLEMKLQELIEDDTLRKKLALNARKTVVDGFTKEDYRKNLLLKIKEF